MSTNFPTSLDALTNPGAGDDLDTAGVLHDEQHANANDAIEALEAKVGIDGSAVTTSHDYKLANSVVLKSLIDAAGDLLVGTADNTVGRLAIGTALQGLRVNSGATGLEWASVSSTDRATIEGFGDKTSASQTNLQLARCVPFFGNASVTPLQVPIVTVRAGSITGISVALSAARTGGTATFEVWKNGVATGLTVVINGTNTQYHYTTQAAGTDTFVAGDRLDVRYTTDGSWAPTAYAEASIEVTYS